MDVVAIDFNTLESGVALKGSSVDLLNTGPHRKHPDIGNRRNGCGGHFIYALAHMQDIQGASGGDTVLGYLGDRIGYDHFLQGVAISECLRTDKLQTVGENHVFQPAGEEEAVIADVFHRIRYGVTAPGGSGQIPHHL